MNLKTPVTFTLGLILGASTAYFAARQFLPAAVPTTAASASAVLPPVPASPNLPTEPASAGTSISNKTETEPAPVPRVEKTIAPAPPDRLGVLSLLGQARNHAEVVAAIEGLLPRLRAGNPMDLANAAMGMPEGVERDMALMLSLGNLASRDPSAALAFAEGLPEGPEREQAIRWIATGLPPGDPSKALALASKIQDPDLQQLVISEVIAAEAAEDPASALKALDQIEDPRTRSAALAATAESWASSDPSDALNFALGQAPPEVRNDLLVALGTAPGADSAALLDAVLAHMPSGDAFQGTVSDLFETWAAKDPSSAALALSKIPPGPAQASAAADIAAAMATSGVSKKDIAAWVATLPEGSTRKEALDSLYAAWGNADPEGAIGEAARLQGAERQAAMVGLIDSWAARNPSRILDWAASGANGFTEAREPATQYGIRAMARHDPAAAAERVAKVPPALRASANSALIEVWSEVDAEAAADWLSKQPRGPEIDGAAWRLATSLVREDPAMAMEWALAISAPADRERTAREVASQWKSNDPASAREFAEQANAPGLVDLFRD